MVYAKEPLPPEKHDWPEYGHVMSHWMVWDKLHYYRQCVHPECGEFEVVPANELK